MDALSNLAVAARQGNQPAKMQLRAFLATFDVAREAASALEIVKAGS